MSLARIQEPPGADYGKEWRSGRLFRRFVGLDWDY
jgi:hypothetical protein